MYLYRYDDSGCIVLYRTGELYQAFVLNHLPVAKVPTPGVIVFAPLDPAEVEKVHQHVVNDLQPYSQPWEIRQVRCQGPQPGASGIPETFTPVVGRLTRERRLQPAETEPAVAIAICGQTSKGPVVLLKRRHRKNAIDDFDRLSLVSEHVIVEDLHTWIDRVPQPLDADDRRAQEQIWRAAGRPRPFLLEVQFFKEAAQRELLLSCGLNVEFNRLHFCGYRLVEREDGGYLGFAVFRLDLIQQDQFDELDIVEGWSEDMFAVHIETLYRGPTASSSIGCSAFSRPG